MLTIWVGVFSGGLASCSNFSDKHIVYICKAVDIYAAAPANLRRKGMDVAKRYARHWLTSPPRTGTAATAAALVAAATAQPQQAALPTSPLMVMSGFFPHQAGVSI